jgi:hypothetical protein
VCELDNVSDNDFACGLAEVVTDAEFVGETVVEAVWDDEQSTVGEPDGARELDIVISSVGDFRLGVGVSVNDSIDRDSDHVTDWLLVDELSTDALPLVLESDGDGESDIVVEEVCVANALEGESVTERLPIEREMESVSDAELVSERSIVSDEVADTRDCEITRVWVDESVGETDQLDDSVADSLKETVRVAFDVSDIDAWDEAVSDMLRDAESTAVALRETVGFDTERVTLASALCDFEAEGVGERDKLSAADPVALLSEIVVDNDSEWDPEIDGVGDGVTEGDGGSCEGDNVTESELLDERLIDATSEKLSVELGDRVAEGEAESVGSGELVTVDERLAASADGESVTVGELDAVGEALSSALGDDVTDPVYSCEGLNDSVTDEDCEGVTDTVGESLPVVDTDIVNVNVVVTDNVRAGVGIRSEFVIVDVTVLDGSDESETDWDAVWDELRDVLQEFDHDTRSDAVTSEILIDCAERLTSLVLLRVGESLSVVERERDFTSLELLDLLPSDSVTLPLRVTLHEADAVELTELDPPVFVPSAENDAAVRVCVGADLDSDEVTLLSTVLLRPDTEPDRVTEDERVLDGDTVNDGDTRVRVGFSDALIDGDDVGSERDCVGLVEEEDISLDWVMLGDSETSFDILSVKDFDAEFGE